MSFETNVLKEKLRLSMCVFKLSYVPLVAFG